MVYSRLPSTQFNKCTFCITLTNRAFSKCEFKCDWPYPDVTKNTWACLTVHLQCKQKLHALQKKTWSKTWITLGIIVEMKWMVSLCMLIQGRIHVWSESAPAPPFWQINHANSAYLFLGYFWAILGLYQPPGPPFLDLGPPLFTYPGSAPVLINKRLLKK